VTDVDDAITQLRIVCQRAVDAEARRDRAHATRRRILESSWPALHPLGYKLIAAQVGPTVTASTMRSMARGLEPRPPRGPRFSPTINANQRAAIDSLREACAGVADAEKAHKEALNARHFTIRRLWPVLSELGPAKVARSVGDRLVGESTIRQAVADLQRA